MPTCASRRTTSMPSTPGCGGTPRGACSSPTSAAPPARAEPVVATPPTSPRAAVEPGAADAGASAAARPLPLVPPPGGERKRPVADYSSDTPSIVTDRVREPGPREAAPRAARRGVSLPRLPALPRPVLIALGTLVVAGLAYFVYGRLRPVPPVISSVLPPRVEPGQTVAIAGTGLGTSAEAVTVRFADQAGQVTSASDTQVSVTVPAALAAKEGVEIPVIVETRAGRSNALFLRVRRVPHPNRLEPDVALPGQAVTLT